MDKSKLYYRLLLQAIENEKSEIKELKKLPCIKNNDIEIMKFNAQLKEVEILEKIIKEVFNYE